MNRRGMSSASLLAAAAGLAAASHAPAAILNWASAINGTASTAARWSPAQVPVATDDLVFNATVGAQAFTVTFDAATPTSRTMVFNEDSVSLSMSSPHTTTSGITIGSASGDNATASLTSGTWTSSVNTTTAFNIGNVGGAIGTLNVSGNSSDLVLSAAAGRLRVGNLGNGTLNVTNQGSVTIGEHLSVATGTGSTGAVTVSGALAVPPFGRSTLISNGSSLESNLGSSGAATVTISNGALADFAGDVEIARGSSSTSNVTVGGAGGLFRATLDVATNLYIGANGSAGLVPGTGSLTVNNGGDAIVGQTLHVGDDPDGGGSATLTINSGAIVSATNLIRGANGTINHAGGTLRINGGTYSGFPLPLSVSGVAANNVVLAFANNGSQTLTPSAGVSLKLGTGTGTGNLFVESGFDLDAGTGDINLGDGNGSTGNATVTGAGSRLIANSVNSDIRVGFNGDGNIDVLAAGQCLFRNLLVPNPTSLNDGLVNISGSNSNITTQFLSIGQNSGGAGLVQAQIGGTLNITDPGFSTNIRATGELSIGGSNAVVSTPGTVTVGAGGTLRVGGTLSNAALVDVSGNLFSNVGVAPLVDAPVHLRTGGTLEAIVGDLQVGTSASTNGVILDSGSIVTVGAGKTLVLSDSNNIVANGRIVLQGGTIQPPLGRFIDMDGAATDQLSGEGTIDGHIVLNDLGTVAPSGTGLVFTGITDLDTTGATDIVGTAIRFAGGSVLRDFSTGHTFNCKVTLDAGAVWQPNTVSGKFHTQAFGSITMGDGSSTGVTLNGIIHMGTNGSLTLNDTFGTNLGTLTDMNGGSITNTTGLNLTSGRILRGHGTINVAPSGTGFQIGPLGTIDPDAYDSASDSYLGVGTFAVNGRYAHALGATYLCELAGFDNEFRPQNDRIDVSGPAVLAGTLDVSLINGYQATRCDTFTILTATSITGQFAVVNKPHNVVVVYNPTSVQLLVSGCVADVDDGSFTGTPDCGVTIDDLLYYLSIFEAGTLDADVDDGSFTGTHDDGVTIDDLLYFLFRFEAGC